MERIYPKVTQGLVAKPRFEFRQSGPGPLFWPTMLFTEGGTKEQKGQPSYAFIPLYFFLHYHHLLPNMELFMILNPKFERHLR